MTEEEAKTTRCCGPEGCGSAITIASNDRFCIGSACMAWRWVTGGAIETKDSHRTQTINARGELVVTITGGIEMGGYCGRAGKP